MKSHDKLNKIMCLCGMRKGISTLIINNEHFYEVKTKTKGATSEAKCKLIKK
jgi:hypothetical protein